MHCDYQRHCEEGSRNNNGAFKKWFQHINYLLVCVRHVNDSLEAVLLTALSFMPFLRKAALTARSFVFVIRLF